MEPTKIITWVKYFKFNLCKKIWYKSGQLWSELEMYPVYLEWLFPSYLMNASIYRVQLTYVFVEFLKRYAYLGKTARQRNKPQTVASLNQSLYHSDVYRWQIRWLSKIQYEECESNTRLTVPHKRYLRFVIWLDSTRKKRTCWYTLI